MWSLAWPVMAHMLLATAVFVVSRVMLGRHSSVALGSMQISGPLLWSIQSVFTAFSTATLAVVGRSRGAGDLPRAATAARLSVQAALTMGVVVVVPLIIVLPELVDAMFPAASPEVRSAATLYTRIVLVGQPLAWMEAVAAAALQGSGDTRTPMRVGILVNVLNLALGPVLLFGLLGAPALGIAGAALAASVALALEGVLLLRVLLRPTGPLPLGQWDPALRSETARRLWSVAWPAVAEKVGYHAGFLAYVALVGRLGDVVMAANQAMVGLESVCFLSAEAFGIAGGALVARKLGAGRVDEARRALLAAAGMSTLVLGVLGAVFTAGGEMWVRMVSHDEGVVAMGVSVVPLMLVLEPVMGFAVVMVMGLRGAGDTRTTLAITFSCALAVRMVATWALTVTWPLGLLGVWLGAAADWACRALLGAWAFRGGRWARLRV